MEFNSEKFFHNLRNLHNELLRNRKWDLDALFVLVGSNKNNDLVEGFQTSIHYYLFECVLPNSAILLTTETFSVLAGPKACGFLQKLISKTPDDFGINFDIINKGDDTDYHRSTVENFKKKVLDASSSRRVKNIGYFYDEIIDSRYQASEPKFIQDTKFVKKLWKFTGAGFNYFDCSEQFSVYFSKKSHFEMNDILKSKKSTEIIFNEVVGKNIVNHFKNDRSDLNHRQLVGDVDEFMANKNWFNEGIDLDGLAVSYETIVQSNGKQRVFFYPSKTAKITSDEIGRNVVNASCGSRYQGYSTYMGRTFIADPSDEQRENLEVLYGIRRTIYENIAPGVTLRSIFQRVREYLNAKDKSALINNFPDQIGWSTGILFYDQHFVISTGADNEQFESGNVFVVWLAFDGLKMNKKRQGRPAEYGLMLVDTIEITEDGCQVLTEGFDKIDDVCHTISDPSTWVEEEIKPEMISSGSSRVRTRRLREKNANGEKFVQRREHQISLANQQFNDMKKRLASYNVKEETIDVDNLEIPFISYGDGKLPDGLKENETGIRFGTKQHSILLPIYGNMVPFHIETIRSVTLSDSGDGMILIINFKFPSKATQSWEPVMKYGKYAFLRSISIKLQDNANRAQEIERRIKKMLKEYKETKENESVRNIEVKQEVVKQSGGSFSIQALLRPSPTKRQKEGRLTAYQNGFVYMQENTRIQIAYSNIDHAILQSASEDQDLVIMHFTLKHPILIGTSLCNQVQFIKNCDPKNVHFQGTEEEKEYMKEQRNKQLIKKYGMAVKEFAKNTKNVWDRNNTGIQWEVVNKDMDYFDASVSSDSLSKGKINFYFTKKGIVCIAEAIRPTFYTIFYDTIDMVVFERVRGQYFEFTVIFKDYSLEQPCITLSGVDIRNLERLKDIFDENDIVFHELEMSGIKYDVFIKEYILKESQEFLDNGGWISILFPVAVDETEMASVGASTSNHNLEIKPTEEEYVPSDLEDDSDFYAYESDNGMDDDEVYEESEDEGLTWDEQEAKAREYDQRSGFQ
eukprot:TRINITY_DN3167_c0_g1_i1.p1 TRINITY_DN3167_c0_g1~~TRINITY_DN3167_c0_g1_i1.p1  ORF type:complete len:1028 (+),score=288.82 TRINITY_DN3167_c0_g1_i1:31-3114(+)